MIGIIDYGMGNLRSVFNALQFIGAQPEIVRAPDDLDRADGIILPGVGAFPDGMRSLRERGFVGRLGQEVLAKGKPFLGICLGLQLLADLGFEHGETAGLGWVRGTVTRLPAEANGATVRVPHIGWNDVRFRRRDGLYAGLGESAAFYFVHSYKLDAGGPAVVSGTCEHGTEFVASIEAGNVCATQYHPEKSHRAGLAVLKNFARMTQGVRC